MNLPLERPLRNAWIILFSLAFSVSAMAKAKSQRFLQEIHVDGPSPYSRYFRAQRALVEPIPREPLRSVETFHQPKGGSWDLTVGPAMSRAGESTSRAFAAALDMGLGDGFSIGVASDYGAVESENQQKSGGWSDARFKMQMNRRAGMSGRVFMNLVYSRSFGPSRLAGRDESGSLVDGGRMSGGDSLAPGLGYQHDLGRRFALGLAATYTTKQERRVRGADGGETKLTGGDVSEGSLTLERAFVRNAVGLSLAHRWKAEGESQALGGASVRREASTAWAGTLYGAFAAGDRVTVLPSLTSAEFTEVRLAARLNL